MDVSWKKGPSYFSRAQGSAPGGLRVAHGHNSRRGGGTGGLCEPPWTPLQLPGPLPTWGLVNIDAEQRWHRSPLGRGHVRATWGSGPWAGHTLRRPTCTHPCTPATPARGRISLRLGPLDPLPSAGRELDRPSLGGGVQAPSCLQLRSQCYSPRGTGMLGPQCGRLSVQAPSPPPPSQPLPGGGSRLWPEAADPGPGSMRPQSSGWGHRWRGPGLAWLTRLPGHPESNSLSLLTSGDGGLTLCGCGPCLVGWLEVRQLFSVPAIFLQPLLISEGLELGVLLGSPVTIISLWTTVSGWAGVGAGGRGPNLSWSSPAANTPA